MLTVVSEEENGRRLSVPIIFVVVIRRRSDQFNLDLVAGGQVDDLATSLVAADDRLATGGQLTLAYDGVLVAERPQMQLVMKCRAAAVVVVVVGGLVATPRTNVDVTGVHLVMALIVWTAVVEILYVQLDAKQVI